MNQSRVFTLNNVLTAIAVIICTTANAHADDGATSRTEPVTARLGSAMSKCVSGIQAHHPAEARLFLNHRGEVLPTDDGDLITVRGWVTVDGERTRVTHQCTPEGGRRVALRIVYGEDEILAGN